MKKNIFKIGIMVAFSLGTALSLNSCRDAVDIVQPGEVYADTYFSSITNMEKFLPTIYNYVDMANPIFISSLLTDEIGDGSSNGGNSISLYRLYLEPNNGYSSSIWLQNNLIITNVNRLMEGAKKITPTTTTEQEKYDKILAEARVLRAFAHMTLLTYFSEDMKDDAQLGSIVYDYVPTISSKEARNTNAEVYQAIEKDLDFAYDKLETQSWYTVSKAMVDAMRARIALYRGKYAEAGVYAQQAIDNSGLSLTRAVAAGATVATWWPTFYNDDSSSPYRQIWSDYSQGEVIFALSRPVKGAAYSKLASYYNVNYSAAGGSPRWTMGYNLFSLLKAPDIRRYAYVDYSSTIPALGITSASSETAIKAAAAADVIIDKYPGKSTDPLKNDIKIFRISEMKFILAEAAVEVGDLAKAQALIQEVRVARSYTARATTPTYTTKQEALQDILKERRIELAFEGHRYIDLKRRGADAGLTSTDRSIVDDSKAPVEQLKIGDYRFTLPIPSQEIAANPKVKQNTGYK